MFKVRQVEVSKTSILFRADLNRLRHKHKSTPIIPPPCPIRFDIASAENFLCTQIMFIQGALLWEKIKNKIGPQAEQIWNASMSGLDHFFAFFTSTTAYHLSR